MARHHSKADHPIDGRSKQARKTHAAGLDPPPARSARLVLQLARFKRGTPAPAEHRDIENLGLGQPSFFHLPRKTSGSGSCQPPPTDLSYGSPQLRRTHARTHRRTATTYSHPHYHRPDDDPPSPTPATSSRVFSDYINRLQQSQALCRLSCRVSQSLSPVHCVPTARLRPGCPVTLGTAKN